MNEEYFLKNRHSRGYIAEPGGSKQVFREYILAHTSRFTRRAINLALGKIRRTPHAALNFTLCLHEAPQFALVPVSCQGSDPQRTYCHCLRKEKHSTGLRLRHSGSIQTSDNILLGSTFILKFWISDWKCITLPLLIFCPLEISLYIWIRGFSLILGDSLFMISFS